MEKVPIRIMHKKNTAVKRQPTMKDVSKMHTTAEDTHEVEKDETNMDKEKKEVENLFAEKGWTVKVSRNRMRSRKVAKLLRSARWFMNSWTPRSTAPLACGSYARGFWGTDPADLLLTISRSTCTNAGSPSPFMICPCARTS